MITVGARIRSRERSRSAVVIASMTTSRRDLFRLAGGAIWISACAGAGQKLRTPPPPQARNGAFLIVQITDTHWGYSGPANPDPHGTVERAIAEIAAWPQQPDLVIHTGDVTQLTTDAAQRKQRLTEAKALFGKLGTELHAVPGEHDASLDRGGAFTDVFGPTHWAFEHRGVYFIGLDNASDPKGGLGDDQLAWLDAEVGKVPPSAQLLVFAHRPLFSLAEPWDWYTSDGERALAILDKHPGATVFYGHIHQANLARTRATTHVSSRALVFPLPAPMSQPEKKPLPWDAQALDHGVGWRGIALEGAAPIWIDRALVG
jgi:3',5'-cyclic AMP phosphodiesterase CpdA